MHRGPLLCLKACVGKSLAKNPFYRGFPQPHLEVQREGAFIRRSCPPTPSCSPCFVLLPGMHVELVHAGAQAANAEKGPPYDNPPPPSHPLCIQDVRGNPLPKDFPMCCTGCVSASREPQSPEFFPCLPRCI